MEGSRINFLSATPNPYLVSNKFDEISGSFNA
jgi:hypothetical protein